MKKILFALLPVFAIACNQPTQQGHDHGDGGHSHDEGPAALSYTLYTDKTELYVEFKPLVVGQTAKFAAHFTHLGEVFTPFTEGSITISLISGGNGIRQTVDSPSSPGIFRLALQPAAAGTGKLVFDVKTKGYTDQIIIENVLVYPNAEAAAVAKVPQTGGDISYLKEQAWKIPFANQPVTRQTFYNTVRTSGAITGAPGDEQVLAAKTAGIVSFSRMKPVTGMTVKPGQVLFTISSKGLTDGNTDVRQQEARNNLAKAKVDFERSQSLYNDRLITERDYLQAKTEYDNARAVASSLSGTYGTGGQRIAASRGGFIRTLSVTEGQFVEAGQPLAVVATNKRLMVRADIAPAAYARIGSIRSANFRVNPTTVYSLQDLNGRLASVGKAAGENGTVPAFFEIDGREGLLPGSFIEVLLQADAVNNALVIPVSALMEDQGTFSCYVQMAGESFEKRELTLGGNDGKNVQVLSGLKEGERVVTKGAYNIKLSTASGTMPAHGHEH
ncbi:efflux RND transporter periplasmic adaptor subunit [Chitinophaga cymbidii]|uniref:CzcB-like C-terminal circularly permuted SH3-like domain-containing protein n=1 Tax=Chitinophaga cymbidii TaxID=1096750 RepID=A0A512RPY0_9BACT|nr:efflux RND transporter periplasmic adaptor subunit [Chitinophaga cymbidii]GEP97751.1 hypothetical protein CCY01nite_40110 [Chitinophaga cymbidii]